MQLTLNQFILLVLTIAAVVLVTFLISFLIQLRKTAKRGEETLAEIRSLASNLRETSQKIQTKLDDVNGMVDATKKTVMNLSEIAWFMTTKIVRPSSKYWPFLFPLLRIGWQKTKKRKKEEKNV